MSSRTCAVGATEFELVSWRLMHTESSKSSELAPMSAEPGSIDRFGHLELLAVRQLDISNPM